MGFPKNLEGTSATPTTHTIATLPSNDAMNAHDMTVIQKALNMIGLVFMVAEKTPYDEDGEVWLKVKKVNQEALLIPIPDPEPDPEFTIEDIMKMMRVMVSDVVGDALFSATSQNGQGTLSLAEQIQDLWDSQVAQEPMTSAAKKTEALVGHQLIKGMDPDTPVSIGTKVKEAKADMLMDQLKKNSENSPHGLVTLEQL